MPGGPHSYGEVVRHHMGVEDLFPDAITGEEVDRRIAHSEARIKFWVMVGVVSNLLAAVSVAVPAVFFIGQISQNVQQAATAMTQIQANQKANEDWVKDRMIWEARIEVALRTKGVEVNK